MTRLFLLVQFLAVSGRVVRIETPNDFQYMYLEDHGITVKGYNNITFLLRASNDGHIALSRYINNWNTNSYEVVLGGWKNRRSAIRRCDQCEAKVTVEHNILKEEELLPFWISWAQGQIRVGSGTQLHKHQFLSWTDSDPDQINHVGVSTGWGANGTWIFGAVDGGWSAWSLWSECSTSCEGGTRTRKRYCNNPQPVYGAECTGAWLQEGICNDMPCAVDGGWSTWGVFGTCSLSCGDGVRVRVRSCDNPPPQNAGSPCEGPKEQTTPCKLKECPVDGSWSEWTRWSSCTKSCGTGEITRRRLCDRPPPQHNGRRCNGSAIESKTCMVVNCPVDGGWSEWSNWSNCSVTCGDGILSRSRDCNRPIPAYGGANCSGPEQDKAACNEAPCPVPGSWSRWSVWEPCTLTCGSGNRSRIRFCDDPPPQYGAPHCAGADVDTSTCNNFPCPVNGGWTSWGSWTACSSSCGTGQYSRTRRCSNPTPNYGGARCRGPSFQQEQCVDTKCPVDGAWSEWSSWSMCSHTCGPGHVQRSRVCDNPEPRFDGLNCSGEWLEVDECLLEECPVDGGWTDWAPWSQCSATCGPGHMTTARWCIFPRPAHGGKSCDGPAVNETQCMDEYCPIDGGWSSWGPWDTCTASCEGGTRVRYRSCTSPPPQYSGRDCLGVSLINETCNIQRCPVPIGWSPWGTWTECSVTCGGGYMARVRECEDPNAFNCVGSDVQNWTCSFVDCPDKWVYEPDDKPVEAPGAVGIGVMSIVFMAFIPAICILIDLISLPAHIRYARRNIKDFKKTLLLLRARWQNREVQYYSAGSRTSSKNRKVPQPSPIAQSSGTANGSTLGLTAGNNGGSTGGSPDSSVPGSLGSEPPDYDNEGLEVDDIIVGDGVDVGHDVIAGHVTPPRRRHDILKHGGGGSSPGVVGNHVDISPHLTTAAIGNHVGVRRAETNHVGAISHDRYDMTPGRDAGTMTQY